MQISSRVPGHEGDAVSESDVSEWDTSGHTYVSARLRRGALAMALGVAVLMCLGLALPHPLGVSRSRAPPAVQLWQDAASEEDLLRELVMHGAGHKVMQQFGMNHLLKSADEDKNGVVGGDKELAFVRNRIATAFKLGPDRYAEIFEEADSNSDGKLTGAELWKLIALCIESTHLEPAAQQLKQRFHISDAKFHELLKKADTDADGKLSVKEIEELIFTLQEEVPSLNARLHTMMHKLFEKADTNENGLIDGPELKLVAQRGCANFGVPMKTYEDLFARADSDKDGRLRKGEFGKLLAALQAESPYWWMKKWVINIFKRWDWDENGLIDEAELRPLAAKFASDLGISGDAYEQMFKQADKNADGKLDAREFQELMAMKRSRMMKKKQHPSAAGQ